VRNALGVWSASAGAGAATWGVFGSVRGAVAVAGVLLLVAAVALLIDVDGDT